MKYRRIIGAIALIAILAGGYFYLQNGDEGENMKETMSDEKTSFEDREIDYEEILEIQKVTNKMDFGPLNNVYKDPNSSFSIRYPDELEIVVDEREFIILGAKNRPGGHKGFSLFIFDQDSVSEVFANATSIEYFKQDLWTEPSEGGSYGQIKPFNPELIPVAKGDPVLKQFYHEREYNIDGKDITSNCIYCNINNRTYIAFKSPDDYHVITSGENNDFELEDLIIRSIEY